MRGTASEVFGIVCETVFRKTVRESRTVTSETNKQYTWNGSGEILVNFFDLT